MLGGSLARGLVGAGDETQNDEIFLEDNHEDLNKKKKLKSK